MLKAWKIHGEPLGLRTLEGRRSWVLVPVKIGITIIIVNIIIIIIIVIVVVIINNIVVIVVVVIVIVVVVVIIINISSSSGESQIRSEGRKVSYPSELLMYGHLFGGAAHSGSISSLLS